MATFDVAAKTADRLISSKGAVVKFTRTSPTSYDPVTQTEVASTTTFSMNGLALPPGRSAEFRIGSLEKRNIIELHLAPLQGPVPEPGDKVTWGLRDWTVVWVSNYDPAADGSPYCFIYAER